MKYEGDDKLLADFKRRHKSAVDDRRPFDEECDLIDKHAEPFNAKWGDDGTAEEMMRAPHIYHVLQTLNANMVEPDPSWDLRPREFMDEASVRATRIGLTYQMERDGWGRKDQRIVNLGNRYGIAIAHIMWEFDDEIEVEEKEIPHRNSLLRIFGRTETIQQEVQRIIKDDASIKIVDRRDFWAQPGSNDLEDAEWVHHRTFVPLSVLEDLAKDGVYRCVDMINAGATETQQKPDLSSEEAESERRRVDEDGVEVITEYNQTTGMILCVANGSTIIRHDKFPYLHGEFPFAAYVPIPQEGRFYGLSPVKPLIKLQERTWLMEDDRMKAVALALNPTLIVAKGLKGNTDFHIQSGGRIFVDDPSQIQQLNLNANSAMGFEEVQAYLGYIQQVSGASPYIAGSDASGYNIDNSTATGVNQLSSAAGRRIGFYIGQHQDAVARIGRQVIKLMNQFMTTERMVRIAGERGAEWVQLSPEDIPFDFDLIVKGSTESLNKSYERQQGIDLLREIASLNGLPSVDGRQFSIVPAVNYVVETFDLNPEEFWPQQDQHTQQQLQAQTDQATAGAQQAQADAQMADPQMQAMMQAQQQGGGDPHAGDPHAQMQQKLFESINFKDMPVDAQAAMLEQLGLPSAGLMQKDQLDTQTQSAKIQQMMSQAASQGAGHDNAMN